MTTTPTTPPEPPPFVTRSELRDHARWLELGGLPVVEAARRAGRIVDELPADVDPVTRQPRTTTTTSPPPTPPAAA